MCLLLNSRRHAGFFTLRFSVGCLWIQSAGSLAAAFSNSGASEDCRPDSGFTRCVHALGVSLIASNMHLVVKRNTRKRRALGRVATSKQSSRAADGDDSAPQLAPAGEALAESDDVAVILKDDVESLPEPKQRTPYDSDTAIRLYLREIGRVKLLTPAEEVELAARIKKGDKQGREQMIKANLRLVVKIAHDYESLGLPLLDLISEGNIGLMKAVERFDPAKGGKLSTYGSWWIKQSIKRALANQSKTIRLPIHLVAKISKMSRIGLKLQEVLGREPTDEELAEELGMSPSRVAQLRTAAIRPASLDAPIGDDDSNKFADIVQDENAATPYQRLEDKTVTKMLQEMVKTLDTREATILRYRFGLEGGTEKTLEEVGEKFGVTRERIRQIQNLALNKLRKMIQKLEAVQKQPPPVS